MIRQLVISSITVLGLVGGSAFASETPSQPAPQQPNETASPFAGMNMMNQQHPDLQRMNLARPEGYVIFMNPMNYARFVNPATYGQFMTPQFYLQFADPNNMMAWTNPAAYASGANAAGTTGNPATAYHWFDPNAWANMMGAPAQPPAPPQQ